MLTKLLLAFLSLLALISTACTQPPAGCGTPPDVVGVWTQTQTVTETTRAGVVVGQVSTGEFTVTLDGDKFTATPANPANTATGTICGNLVKLSRAGTENGVAFTVTSESTFTATTFSGTAIRTYADGTLTKFSNTGSKKP